MSTSNPSWFVDVDGSDRRVVQASGDYHTVAVFTTAEEAARSVKAVNAHDDLVKALKAAIEPLQLYQAYGWADRGGVISQLQAALKNAGASA